MHMYVWRMSCGFLFGKSHWHNNGEENTKRIKFERKQITLLSKICGIQMQLLISKHTNKKLQFENMLYYSVNQRDVHNENDYEKNTANSTNEL